MLTIVLDRITRNGREDKCVQQSGQFPRLRRTLPPDKTTVKLHWLCVFLREVLHHSFLVIIIAAIPEVHTPKIRSIAYSIDIAQFTDSWIADGIDICACSTNRSSTA